MDEDKPEPSDIYQRYNFEKRIFTQELPIEKHRQEILDKIRQHTVVVLRGPTGKYL